MPKRFFLLTICLVLTFGLVAEAQTGRKFAFLVGVNRYHHPRLTELRYCENDVGEMSQLLQGGNYQVTLLQGADATKGNIDQRLGDLLRVVQPNDTVVVGFAGHGLQFQDDAYFCPVDGRPFVEEVAGLVSLGKVYKDMDRSFARVKVLLVDACRNDGTRGLRGGADGDSSPRPPRGVAAFFSCAAGEVAHEVDQFRHGVFFHHVIEGLRGKARNGKGTVTFHSLVEYVSEEVTATVERIGGGAHQSPNMKADLNGSSPVLLAANFASEKQDTFRDEKKEDYRPEAKKEYYDEKKQESKPYFEPKYETRPQSGPGNDTYPPVETKRSGVEEEEGAVEQPIDPNIDGKTLEFIYGALDKFGIDIRGVERNTINEDNVNNCYWVRVRFDGAIPPFRTYTVNRNTFRVSEYFGDRGESTK